MKVQEFASELNISLPNAIAFLREMNIHAKSGSHKLDPGTASKMKGIFESRQKKEDKTPQVREAKTVVLDQKTIKVSNLVNLLGVTVTDVLRVFLTKGMQLNINSEVDQNTAIEIGKNLNIEVKIENNEEEEQIGLKTTVLDIEEEGLNAENAELITRAPVITIMGHVDHGKTKLLDTIRRTNVIDKEAGGITQHIGAYQITYHDHKLTFLDTPGHEAFTAMRARGAQVTDIIILVVAADDGVMPQTIEAIDHAIAADVPILVAINKIDKPGANLDTVKQQLSQHNLLAEDWGGKITMVPLSAKTGEGIPELLEMIILTAEMLELKANKNGLAKGIIIESNLSKQKGALATILVKTGCLKVGDYVVVGSTYGKVRALHNDLGKAIKKAEAGTPVEILGLNEVPFPGLVLEAKATEKECRALAEERLIAESSEIKSTQRVAVSLESLSSQAEEGHLRQLNLVIKADVHGSLEAIKSSIDKIDSQDIPIKILHASTGNISENDIMLAQASKALVVGFGVQSSPEAKILADKESITIKTYKIIYEILNDVERVIHGLYKPVFEEIELGKIEVREIYKFSKVSIIAGCYVLDGKAQRGNRIRVYRGKSMIHESRIDSLKRFKEDVKEVKSGYECGIVVNDFDKFEIGDIIIPFEEREKKLI